MQTKEYLSRISSLVVVIGIYLYFTAWTYIHFYYESFGLSTVSIRVDYSSYLVYSWDVLTATPFLLRTGIFLVAVLIGRAAWPLLRKKFNPGLADRVRKKGFALLLVLMILVFPYLFFSARSAALLNYRLDRIGASHLKTIQFLFKQAGEELSPAVTLDSVSRLPAELVRDIQLIKKDSNQQLKLLGETDNDYIVLNQPPYDDSLKIIPTGSVYFVHKADLLLTKIILRSTN
jgi:hypothetical protein